MLAATGNLTFENVTLIGAVFAAAVILTLISEKEVFDSLSDKVSGASGSKSYSDAMSRDETFEWINKDFFDSDNREEWEIVESRKNTRHQMLSINTNDGTDYIYRAIKAPFKHSDEQFFVVVDCITRTVVFDDTVEKESQKSGDMFDSCPEVKRMRKLNKSQGVTTDQLRQQTQQMAMNPMMPMYGGGQQTQQSPQTQNNNQNDSDEGEE